MKRIIVFAFVLCVASGQLRSQSNERYEHIMDLLNITNRDSAILQCDQIINSLDSVFVKNNKRYIEIMNQVATVYYWQGEQNKSKNVLDNIYFLYENGIYDPDSNEYATICYNLGYVEEDIDKKLTWYKRALANIPLVYDTANLFPLILESVKLYFEYGQYNNVDSMLIARIYNDGILDGYLKKSDINWLISIIYQFEDNDVTREMSKYAISVLENMDDDEICDFTYSIVCLPDLYAFSGRADQSPQATIASFERLKKCYLTDECLKEVLENIYGYLVFSKRYGEALSIMNSIDSIIDYHQRYTSQDPQEHIVVTYYMASLKALLYHSLNKKESALFWLFEELRLIKQLDSIKFDINCQTADTYHKIYEVSGQMCYLDSMIVYYKNCRASKSQVMVQYSILEKLTGEFVVDTNRMLFHTDSLKILIMQNQDVSFLRKNLLMEKCVKCYDLLGLFDSALNLQKYLITNLDQNLYLNKYMDPRPGYGAIYWGETSILYDKLGVLDSVTKYITGALKMFDEWLMDYYDFMDTESQNFYFEAGYGAICRKHLSRFAYKYYSDSLISMAYNDVLKTKGIQLSTYQTLKQHILHSEDQYALSLFDTLQSIRGIIANDVHESHSEYERLLVIDQKLKKRVKTYGSQLIDLSIEWTDVQKSLQSDEAAIEFNSFTTDNDTTIYVAYIIRPQWSAPKQVVLTKLTKGESLSSSNFYSNPRLSNVIWKRLSTTLDDAKTIYFAPSGELYNIAIESLPDYEDSTRLISDRYNFYRLSSTRELAKEKKKASIKNGSIYGGLRYDATIDTTLRGADGQRSFTYFPWSSGSISFSRGNTAAFLPGTLAEAKSVYDFMKRASINTKMFTDSLGTELSFKQMSGSDVNVIQIGTHGFYYDGNQEVKSERESVVEEDKSMTRSGLLFAGANMTLQNGMPNTSTYNDGILTAAEIAQLDLKNVDLVVLSACESGLGELKGDGVFGLQRGFKKAGVNSIIMSLWKVDDRATQMLMTRFYENWLIKKMTKQKALREAQESVRNFEVDETEWAIELRRQRDEQRGVGGNFRSKATTGKSKKTNGKSRMIKPYQDPKYWAAFILLDGLD